MIDISRFNDLKVFLESEFKDLYKPGTGLRTPMLTEKVGKNTTVITVFEADLVFYGRDVQFKHQISDNGDFGSKIRTTSTFYDKDKPIWLCSHKGPDSGIDGRFHGVHGTILNYFRSARLRVNKNGKVYLVMGRKSVEVDPALFPELKDKKPEDLVVGLRIGETYGLSLGDTVTKIEQIKEIIEPPKKKSSKKKATPKKEVSEFLHA